MGFKEWYETKHGTYPGSPNDLQHNVVLRLCDAVAEYVDLKTNVPRMPQIKWTPELEEAIQRQQNGITYAVADEDDGA